MDASWSGESAPIVFVRPVGIAAGDAMRLMELAKRLRSPVRWRMAPPGVAADVYVAHRFSVMKAAELAHADTVPTGDRGARGMGASPAFGASSSHSTSYASSQHSRTKLLLDAHGWHRGRPVCVLGDDVDTSDLDEDELAPLNFPDALRDMEHALGNLLADLTGVRMLYTVGELAWQHRSKWQTHRLHAIESGQLVGVIDTKNWQFHLRDGCTVERMAQADMMPMPESGAFEANGFHSFMFEAALWEFAKRCPEPQLAHMLPTAFLKEPLTHRRSPHLKENALGDHCVAILRALDTRARTADELEMNLRMARPSLMRALTCLALVRAIQPQSNLNTGLGAQLGIWWQRITGQPRASHSVFRASLALKR
jgi:hypothetical protein